MGNSQPELNHMNIVSIEDIAKLPKGTALEAVQASVSKVYPPRTVSGGKAVQNLQLRSGSGTEIKLTAWEHSDLAMYEGREVVIQSGPKGGLKVDIDTYKGRNTNYISASRMATFQVVSGGTPAAQPAVAATNPTPAPVAANAVVINGAKVGMCINNAVLFMTQAGEAFDAKRLHGIASEILRVSQKLENNELSEPKRDEDVPF